MLGCPIDTTIIDGVSSPTLREGSGTSSWSQRCEGLLTSFQIAILYTDRRLSSPPQICVAVVGVCR